MGGGSGHPLRHAPGGTWDRRRNHVHPRSSRTPDLVRGERGLRSNGEVRRHFGDRAARGAARVSRRPTDRLLSGCTGDRAGLRCRGRALGGRALRAHAGASRPAFRAGRRAADARASAGVARRRWRTLRGGLSRAGALAGHVDVCGSPRRRRTGHTAASRGRTDAHRRELRRRADAVFSWKIDVSAQRSHHLGARRRAFAGEPRRVWTAWLVVGAQRAGLRERRRRPPLSPGRLAARLRASRRSVWGASLSRGGGAASRGTGRGGARAGVALPSVPRAFALTLRALRDAPAAAPLRTRRHGVRGGA
jgi:hypothetical protein